MKKRVFWSMLAVSLLTGLFLVLIVLGLLPSFARERTLDNLQREAAVILPLVNTKGDEQPALAQVLMAARVTLIGPDGRVLFDNQADPATMDNHLDRPEVREAMEIGRGSAVRRSYTQSEDMQYFALSAGGGRVLRLASPVYLTRIRVVQTLPWLLGALLISLLVASLLSRRISLQLSQSISRIDPDAPEEVVTFEELTPLLSKLSKQSAQVAQQLNDMQEKQQQMDALIDGMTEGFMVLDCRRRVVSINRSAAAMLHVNPQMTLGRTLPEISRKPEIINLLDELEEKGNVQITLPWGKRSYSLNASRVAGTKGVVILLHDITETLEGDAMRKRFTANVSHELRTPLTAICGYSEMLSSGMVNKEDEQSFLDRISSESKRLLALIEDILRLSKLDEGNPGGEYKRINLFTIAREVVKNFAPAAEKMQVDVTLRGDRADVMGDETLLGELVGNLLDNAIKYNRHGGKVEISILEGKNGVDLTVHDTGIGIEQAQQDKIFERFYRTDKSRSKETGGTGLGLSIVKHSAEFHNATLRVDSEPGVGTTITASFPLVEKKAKKK